MPLFDLARRVRFLYHLNTFQAAERLLRALNGVLLSELYLIQDIVFYSSVTPIYRVDLGYARFSGDGSAPPRFLVAVNFAFRRLAKATRPLCSVTFLAAPRKSAALGHGFCTD